MFLKLDYQKIQLAWFVYSIFDISGFLQQNHLQEFLCRSDLTEGTEIITHDRFLILIKCKLRKLFIISFQYYCS